MTSVTFRTISVRTVNVTLFNNKDEKEVANMCDKRIQKVWRKKFKEAVRELDYVHVVRIQLRVVEIIRGWDQVVLGNSGQIICALVVLVALHVYCAKMWMKDD
jgi:hypothetical protein